MLRHSIYLIYYIVAVAVIQRSFASLNLNLNLSLDLSKIGLLAATCGWRETIGWFS